MRRVAILCTVPVVVIAAAAAGVLIWSAQQNPNGIAQSPPSSGAALPPSSSAPPADEPKPRSAPSEDASGSAGEKKEATAKAVSDCRRDVARAESVLQAGSGGVEHWRLHVQAQTDLSLGRNTEAETKAIWKPTKLAGPSDVAKYETAKSGYKPAANACKEVSDATADQADQLKLCQARLGKVRTALAATDLAMDDWASHLADMRKSAGGQVHNAQEVWLNTWRKAPPNLEKYATAMDALAKTKSCPS